MKLLARLKIKNYNKILECAKAGNVNYIVSNDNHLLKLGKFENIPILNPEEFIKKLK